MATQSIWEGYASKQSRGQHNQFKMAPSQAGQVPQRQLTVTPGSPPTGVTVLDSDGVNLATVPHGQRDVTFKGRGDISVIVFTVNGIARRCNLTGLQWLDHSSHIGITTRMRRGEPVCTLEDLSETVMTQDIHAQMPGNRCVYMTDQRGQSGMICE